VWVLIAPKIQHLTILQGDDIFFPALKMQKRIGNGWKKESPVEFSFELNWGKWRGERAGRREREVFLQPVLTIG
jgi:hypothetical protein